jgi:hypothetical protein
LAHHIDAAAVLTRAISRERRNQSKAPDFRWQRRLRRRLVKDYRGRGVAHWHGDYHSATALDLT